MVNILYYIIIDKNDIFLNNHLVVLYIYITTGIKIIEIHQSQIGIFAVIGIAGPPGSTIIPFTIPSLSPTPPSMTTKVNFKALTPLISKN